MELFWLEHKKLWRKLSVKVSVFLCFTYIVIFGGILSFQWFEFGSTSGFETGFGNNFDGYSFIKERQRYAGSFSGNLTDETLQELVRDYQRIISVEMEEAEQKTDHKIINTWLRTLWPELVDVAEYNSMITYVDSDKLINLYEKRHQALEEFLANNNQTGKEREYILQMNEKVNEPFHYDWTQGWSHLLCTTVADMGTVMALFIAIVLSSLFAGEWHDDTSSLILTTKKGWKESAYVKICVGITFTVELFTILALGVVAVQLFFLGTSGWDMPIQNIKILSVAPMNVLQAEIYELAFTLLGAIGFAGIVMLISAVVKSNVLALILSLAVVYFPPMIISYLPIGMQKAIDLLPLVGSGADIFRTNTFNIFGKFIWSPYLLIVVPVLIGIVCMPFAVKNWSRRIKA